MSQKRAIERSAAAPKPGTPPASTAVSQIVLPVVLAWASRRPWLVSPMPRRGELITRAKLTWSAGLTIRLR